MDFIDIDKNLPNGDNMGGLAQSVIFGLYSDVAQWPTAPVAPADIEENGAWVGDLVMKAGKKAFTFYSTEDTAEMQINPVGEIDGMSLEVVLNIFNPGLKKKILGFMGAVKNENLFFIVQDSEGQYYLIGDSLRAAKMQSGGDGVGTGKATSDRKGAGFSFIFKTNILRTYVGDVTGLLSVASS